MAGVQKPLQLTLAVLKPDLLVNPFRAKAVKEHIINAGFFIIRSRFIKWTWDDSAKFYADHKGQFFYNRLLVSMTGGVMNPLILARHNAVAEWRRMIGPAKVFKSLVDQPQCLRVQYGFTDTRNGMHGADSEESVAKEIPFFFPDFDIEEWMENEEATYRTLPVEYDPENGVHRVIQPESNDPTNDSAQADPKLLYNDINRDCSENGGSGINRDIDDSDLDNSSSEAIHQDCSRETPKSS